MPNQRSLYLIPLEVTFCCWKYFAREAPDARFVYLQKIESNDEMNVNRDKNLKERKLSAHNVFILNSFSQHFGSAFVIPRARGH